MDGMEWHLIPQYLFSFNNSLSFDYPEAASFVWPVVFISF
jgi:hypothetical protein